MLDPVSEEELGELEAEVKAASLWALDEADVHLLQLRKRALQELRALRTELAELRLSEQALRTRVDNAEAQLRLVRTPP